MSRYRPTLFSANIMAAVMALTTIGCLTTAPAMCSEHAENTGGFQKPTAPLSLSPIFKAIAPSGMLDDRQPGIVRWHDYGTFALYKISPEAHLDLTATTSALIGLEPIVDQLQFDRHPIDTRMGTANVPQRLSAPAMTGPELYLIQFVGPIKDA